MVLQLNHFSSINRDYIWQKYKINKIIELWQYYCDFPSDHKYEQIFKISDFCLAMKRIDNFVLIKL